MMQMDRSSWGQLLTLDVCHAGVDSNTRPPLSGPRRCRGRICNRNSRPSSHASSVRAESSGANGNPASGSGHCVCILQQPMSLVKISGVFEGTPCDASTNEDLSKHTPPDFRRAEMKLTASHIDGYERIGLRRTDRRQMRHFRRGAFCHRGRAGGTRNRGLFR